MVPTKLLLCQSIIEEYCSKPLSTNGDINALNWKEKSDELIKFLIMTDTHQDSTDNVLVALDFLGYVNNAYEHSAIEERDLKKIKEKEGAVYFSFSNINYINGSKVTKESRTVSFRDLIDLLPSE